MNYKILTNSQIFAGVSEEEAVSLLKCLDAKEETFKKDEIIFRAGEKISKIGLVMSGGVNIESYDFLGGKSILAHIGIGETFGEAYALAENEVLTINAAAAEKTEILFLNAGKMITACPDACPYHSRIIRNLLTVSATKNLRLTEKITNTSPKSIRARLISYLSAQCAKQGGYCFDIPFSRQQLADYLCVDRSALSNELGKMRDEGILDFHKNSFRLKQTGFESN